MAREDEKIVRSITSGDTKMTDEITQETQDEPVQPDGAENENETTEVVEENPNAELLQEYLPELAANFGELSGEAQVNVLLQKLAAERASKTADGVASDEAPVGDSQVAGGPSARELPPIDRDAMRKAAVEYTGDETEADRLMTMFAPMIDYQEGVAQRTLDVSIETGQMVSTLRKDLSDVTVPNQLRALVNKVPGATDSHIPAAMQLLQDGVAGTPEAALGYAVFRSQAVLQKSSKAATADGKRTAGAIAASNVGGPNRQGGATGVPLSAGMAKILEEQEAQRK